MTDSSKARKNKKITYTASTQGIERAENALRRLGFESKSNFAESQLISRSTVTKFFQGQPIQLDSFKRICKALKLNWAEIAGIIEEGQSESLGINSYSSLDTEQVVGQMQVSHRKVTVIDEKSKTNIAVITLEGDIDSIDNWKIIESIARQYSGNSINIIDIKKGSIRLIIEGSQEDIKLLVSRIESGELTELNGFPVEDIQILNQGLDSEESDELDDKWRLVQEIVSHAVRGRNLRDADLSDADLSGTDLSRADLSNADLSNADLSGAYLSDANLSDANLSGANLSGANLSDAYLSDAYLSDANLSGANLSDAYLSDAILRGANLRGAHLSGANLIFANLRGANLSGAYLSGAYLRGAHLSGANLSDANLIFANLRGANLSGADLSDANLNTANVENARFGNNQGISKPMKRELIQRGAIFEDSPGDRSGVLLPR